MVENYVGQIYCVVTLYMFHNVFGQKLLKYISYYLETHKNPQTHCKRIAYVQVLCKLMISSHGYSQFP